MTGTEDHRARYAAVLRAIADAVEADDTLPVPHGYLSTFPRSGEAAVRFLRAIPLPWTAQPPGAREHHFTLQGDLGEYTSNGMRLYVHAEPEHVATAEGARPGMVTEWQPRPEIAALLAEQPEGSEGQ